MNIDFELVLFLLTLISGLIALADVLFFAPGRKKAGETRLPVLSDYSRSLFPIFLIVFLLRSFLYEPFRIPSGSLEPTLLVDDLILVNKYEYGLRLPVWRKKIFDLSEPERGDIVVFRYPRNEKINYIKRVVGVPGDVISYMNKTLYINGEQAEQVELSERTVPSQYSIPWTIEKKQENLLGVEHEIQIYSQSLTRNFFNLKVPAGQYFMMGDNRDDSSDSRVWGFMPERNIVGKAVLVWMSWDPEKYRVRFSRIGKPIK